MRIIGIKQKMTQIYKKDKAYGVTPVKFANGEVLSSFKDGDLVKVSSISKGKGFEGVVKRHGFAGGPKTHGQKNRYRAPGSIGSTAPQRTLPGRRMAGRMGGVRISVKNLRVVEILTDEKAILLHGAIPGNRGRKVEISKM